MRHPIRSIVVITWVSTLLLAFAFTTATWATPEAPAASANQPKRDHLYFTLKAQGHAPLRFRVEKELDQNGRLTVTASFVEQRTLMPDTERAVLYGRDLNDDGHADTWYVRSGHSISAIYSDDAQVGDSDGDSDSFGMASINRIVAHHLELENRWLVGIALRGAAKIASFAVSNAEQVAAEYANTQLELLELYHRAQLKKPDAQTLATVDALFKRGWELNNRRLRENTRGSQYYRNSALDLATAIAGIKIFRWAKQGGHWVLVKVGNTLIGRKLLAQLPKASKGPAGVGAHLTAQITFQGLTYETLKQELKRMIIALSAQNQFAHEVAKVAAREMGRLGKTGSLQVLKVYKTGVSEWKYFTASQLTQVLAEGIARQDVIYDPNPLVMAERLFTDKDFIQNFLYMSNETLLLTGISAGDPNVKRRMIVCGVVSIVNSTLMNVAVKGNADPARIGLDAGWEVVVGNLQVQADLAAIRYFERLAVKRGNPKVRILGYVITLVDQFLGYGSYARATGALDRYQVRLVPVIAEEPVP